MLPDMAYSPLVQSIGEIADVRRPVVTQAEFVDDFGFVTALASSAKVRVL